MHPSGSLVSSESKLLLSLVVVVLEVVSESLSESVSLLSLELELLDNLYENKLYMYYMKG